MSPALRGVAVLAALVGCAGPPGPLPEPGPPAGVESEIPADHPPCHAIERLEIRKRARRLIAHCVGGARFETTVAIGREPEGTKQAAGDLRTPEGAYRIAGPLEASRFHGFLPLDYPSLDDAERALASGRISRSDYERISAAHSRGERPPADTPLGGWIGLHGEGSRWQGTSTHLDWTLGCLAVEDEALDYLTERLPPGTPVFILP